MKSLKHYLQILKGAISGEEYDYTSGSINKAIFLLSVPMILEMLMESLFAVVDAFYVAKLGVAAMATVGLTETMLTIIYSLAIGLSTAATATVARRVGEKRPDLAGRAAIQAIYIGLALSVLISIIGLLFSSKLLGLMGAEAEVISIGSPYTKWMLVGNLPILLLFLNNGIFRGAGNASIAMWALVLSNGLNIILDPILIFGWGPIPAYGIEGAAMATFLGRSIAVVYQFWQLARKSKAVHIILSKINREVVWRLVKIASGGAGQFLIASASWIVLVRIMSIFGSEALAGYTIGIRVIIFAILPAFGMANAAATLVGQNLGAGQPDRAEQSVWKTAFYNMLFLGLVTVVFFMFAEQIISMFSQESAVMYYGIQCLQIVCLGYIFYAYGMVVTQSFNGAGDTKTPTLLNIVGFWMLQIPLAYLLSVILDMGPLGVFLAISIAESAIAVAAIMLFRRGKWKAIKV